MRVVGATAILLAIIIAVAGSLSPVTVDVPLAGSTSCGVAIVNAFGRHGSDPLGDAIAQRCAADARQRMLFVGGVAFAITIGGVVILALGANDAQRRSIATVPPPGWYPTADGHEERWWDGRTWTTYTRPRQHP